MGHFTITVTYFLLPRPTAAGDSGGDGAPPEGCPIEEATKGELPKSAIGAIAPVEVLRFLTKYVTIFMKRSTKTLDFYYKIPAASLHVISHLNEESA